MVYKPRLLSGVGKGHVPLLTAAAPISLPKSLRAELLAHFSRQGRFAQLRKEDLAPYIAAHPEVRDRLQRLNTLLRPADLHFGYRVFDEIVAYLVAATDNGLYENSEEAMDAAVLMKILPKFHGSRAQLLEPLYDVLAWWLNPDAPDQATINQRRQNQTDSANGVARTKGLETLAFFYPRTARRVLRLLTALYTTGFAAFS